MGTWRDRIGKAAPSRGDNYVYEFYRMIPDNILLTKTDPFTMLTGRLDNFDHFNETKVDYGYDKNGYDNANRLTYLKNLKEDMTTVIASYDFTLDGNWNRTQVVRAEPVTTTLDTSSVTYYYKQKECRKALRAPDSAPPPPS